MQPIYGAPEEERNKNTGMINEVRYDSHNTNGGAEGREMDPLSGTMIRDKRSHDPNPYQPWKYYDYHIVRRPRIRTRTWIRTRTRTTPSRTGTRRGTRRRGTRHRGTRRRGTRRPGTRRRTRTMTRSSSSSSST